MVNVSDIGLLQCHVERTAPQMHFDQETRNLTKKRQTSDAMNKVS